MKRKAKRPKRRVTPLSREQRARLNAFHRYLKKWSKDDSGEQQETWDLIKEALGCR